jgi:hypothetical protein
MMLKYLISLGFLILATSCETTGDAFVRIGLYDRTGIGRVVAFVGGGALLFCYGFALNLAPLPFERVVGLYIATLFIVWQVVSFFTFRTLPNLPILVGGALIIIGGLLVSFWSPAPAVP